MEYHDQPLQFISTHFIQAKNKNVGEYLNITTLISSFATFPLLGMPTVAYLTNHYIYLEISVFMEKYAEYLSIDPSSRIRSMNAAAKHFFPGCCCICITIFLFSVHYVSSILFVEYGKEILHDDDLNLPYLHVACSWLAIIGLYATCITIAIYFLKKKKEDINIVIIMNHFTASAVSLNVIYIICYFSPFMLLAFIRDPLVTTLTYCTIVFFIVVLIWPYTLLVKEFENHMHSVFILESTRVHKALFILSGAGLSLSVFSIIVMLIIFVSSATALGSFNDFQSLQILLLSLLVGLVSFSIAKPVYKRACKHVNLIKKASVEEQQEDLKSIAANDPARKTATNILKHLDDDDKTEEMSMDNKNDDYTVV